MFTCMKGDEWASTVCGRMVGSLGLDSSGRSWSLGLDSSCRSWSLSGWLPWSPSGLQEQELLVPLGILVNLVFRLVALEA